VDKALTAIPQALPCLRFARTKLGGRDRRSQVQCRRDVDGQPDQGISRRQSAHIAPVFRELRTPARTHQGAGTPLDLSVGEGTVGNWFRGDFANIYLVST